MPPVTTKRPLEIFLASPRGFCTGVERAIKIVEEELKAGAPPYVLHEIVHNEYIVNGLKSRGVVFVKDIAEVPDGATLVFSAHGVSKKIEQDAKSKVLRTIDATCPLVKKVHVEAQRYFEEGRQVLIIGHKGHSEVEGTAGRIPNSIIVSSKTEATDLKLVDEENVAFVTQTTLDIDETAKIVFVLRKIFPKIIGPDLNDICYATKSRQEAVKDLVKKVEILFVIGSKNSSNSNRLREIGSLSGLPSYLINGAKDLDLSLIGSSKKLGLTAGASAPEVLVQEVIGFLSKHFDVITPSSVGADGGN